LVFIFSFLNIFSWGVGLALALPVQNLTYWILLFLLNKKQIYQEPILKKNKNINNWAARPNGP
jgi:hypothetical protein